MEPILKARGLKRHYRRGVETVKALDGVDLDLFPGEMVSILGPSGSGKTTLMNLVSCLDAPTEGTLELNGKPPQNKDRNKKKELVRSFFI